MRSPILPLLIMSIAIIVPASAQDQPIAVPVALPNPAGCGDPIGFDGSGSFHENPHREIVDWKWDFSYSGGAFEAEAAGPFVEHAFPAFGSYLVALQVTDNSLPPLTDIETIQIDVVLGNRPPVAVAGGPYIVALGQALQLDGSGSWEPDESCGDGIVEYAWDLDDDGSFDFWGLLPEIPWTVLEQRLQPGVPTPIRLRIMDSFGLDGTDVTTVTLNTDAPVAFIYAEPNPAACGQPVQFDGGGSYHENPARTIVEWEWDFDHTPGNFIPEVAGPFVEYPFPTFGVHLVALRVTDDGLPPQTDITQLFIDVTLGNQPPIAFAGGPYIIAMDQPLQLDGSGSTDPDQECGDGIVEYEWDLNDDGSFDFWGLLPEIPWSEISGLLVPGVPTPLRLQVTDSFGLMNWNLTTVLLEDISEVTDQVLPTTYRLLPNVPNPFNPATTIYYDVPTGGGQVSLRVYDVTGRLVKVLTDGPETAGRKSVPWQGRDRWGNAIASGVYYVVLQAEDVRQTQKVTLLQ